MEWLNIHASFLDSPEFIGSEPTDRATWICLLRYCAGQENGGIIADAGSWGDRKWQQLARVTLREVRRESALWKWEDGKLIVAAYPADKEELVKQRRSVARKNGMRGGRPSATDQHPEKKTEKQTNAETQQEPTLVLFAKAEGEGEGNGKKYLPAPAAPARKRDELFDCLAKAEGSDPLQLTKRAARTVAVALAEIRKASPAVTAEEIARRAERYRRVMPQGSTMTASALAKHWARCGEIVRISSAPPKPTEPANWRATLKRLFPDASDDLAWPALPESVRQQILNS